MWSFRPTVVQGDCKHISWGHVGPTLSSNPSLAMIIHLTYPKKLNVEIETPYLKSKSIDRDRKIANY